MEQGQPRTTSIRNTSTLTKKQIRSKFAAEQKTVFFFLQSDHPFRGCTRDVNAPKTNVRAHRTFCFIAQNALPTPPSPPKCTKAIKHFMQKTTQIPRKKHFVGYHFD